MRHHVNIIIFFSDIVQYKHAVRKRRKKLRIGYISPDLGMHVVVFFCYVMLKYYDRNCFEIYAYAKLREDAVSAELKESVDAWRNILWDSPEQTANRIYKDQIDILVDLAGHTADNCLPVLAYKPAPVQVSGIGWFDTTGLQAVDYFLADNFLDPVGKNDPYFTEKLLRLPNSHFCYSRYEKSPCQPASFLRNGYITFGSLNNFAKVTDEMLTVWGEILKRVPQSRLFLKASIFENEYGKSKVTMRLQEAGINLDCVDMEPYTVQYMNAYEKIDIALDTYPYPGGGTTCDALYMGVPVITLVGQRHNARFGYSLLQNLSLEECCAYSLEEYIEKAVHLAADKSHLQELHLTLRRRMQCSPLMDEALYMKNLELAYQRIWSETGLELSDGTDDESAWRMARCAHRWEDVLVSGIQCAAKREPSAELCEAIGTAYYHLGRPMYRKRAVVWLKQAIEKSSGQSVKLLLMLGESCLDGLDYEGAMQAFLRAIHSGENGEVMPAELCLKAANLFLKVGRPELAAEILVSGYEKGSFVAESEKVSFSGSLLRVLQYLPQENEGVQELQDYCRQIVSHGKTPLLKVDGSSRNRIRVGYLSDSFYNHSNLTAYYGLLSCYERTGFEIICYQRNKKTDVYTEHLKQLPDHWRDISAHNWEEAAKQIAEDRLDVLVDLSGDDSTDIWKILTRKPAPVLISGILRDKSECILTADYYIVEKDRPEIILQGEDASRSKFLEVPARCSYTGKGAVPLKRGTFCKKSGEILFGVFNDYAKIADNILWVWRNLLEKVPNSRLLLRCSEFESVPLMDMAYARMKSLKFNMNQILLEADLERDMSRYLDVDILLDTFPLTMGTRVLDALYMGVPVISCRKGEGSNLIQEILKQVGVEELLVTDMEEYAEKAAALAMDREMLDLLHGNLRQMVDGARELQPANQIRRMEDIYRRIYGRMEFVQS